MRRIAATYIFPISQAPIKNGILVCEDNGTVVEIIKPKGEFREGAGIEFYSGILVPGFVALNDTLQNLTKIQNRKVWARGIAAVADIRKLIYVIAERNACDFLKLNAVGLKNVLPSNLVISENDLESASFLTEWIVFQGKHQHTKLTDLLKSLSLDAAINIGLEEQFGSFDSGKRPGINLLSGIDYQQMKLTSNFKIKRLL